MTGLSSLASEFSARVGAAESVLIGTHLNPDGDALGSALAMSFYLDQIGVQNEVICNNLAPYNLQFLPGLDRLRLDPKRNHPMGIVLDLDALHRLGRTASYFEACDELIVIDHHVPHEQPGHLRIVDTKSPATALILYRLLVQLGATISSDMATCLLTGIVTDTGSFRYRNTTPESLDAAGALLEAGGDIVRVSEEVYQKRPLASVRLLGRCLDHLKLAENDRLAWSILSAEDFEQTGSSDQHTEGMVNEMLGIDTVQIAALIRQPTPGQTVRASLRSREPFDVASAARKFGGGGHRNAAGCTFEGATISEAEDQLVAALKSCLES